MGKKRLVSGLVIFMFTLTLSMLSIETGSAEAASNKVIKLTFPTSRGHNLERGPWVTTTLGKWVKEVEEASGGRVKITERIGAAPDTELFEMVARGAADITFLTVMYNPGRFPCYEAMTLPDIGTVCERQSRVAWEFWKTHPEIDKEFREVKLLGMFATGTAPPGISFATVNKPVYKLEDFKGLKMGIYGEWGTKLMAALGAVPVSVTPPEVYEALQRKIVDASCMDSVMLEAFKIYEIVKYWHNLPYQFVPWWFAMNRNTWNRLPPDIQKIFEDATARLPDRVDYWIRTMALDAIQTGKEKYGMEVIDFTQEEILRWQERQDPVQAEYIKRLEKRGIDGEKLFSDLDRLYAKHAQW